MDGAELRCVGRVLRGLRCLERRGQSPSSCSPLITGTGIARAASDGTLARYAPRSTMLACSATIVAPQIGGLCLAAKSVQAFIIVTMLINQFLLPGSVPVDGNDAAP